MSKYKVEKGDKVEFKLKRIVKVIPSGTSQMNMFSPKTKTDKDLIETNQSLFWIAE